MRVTRWTLGTLLAAALQVSASLPAQILSPDPTLTGSEPGNDGGGCSGTGWSGNLGANEVDAANALINAANFSVNDRAISAPSRIAIPKAVDATGTVLVSGDLVYRLDLPDTASLSGYRFDLGLIFRSNRSTAAVDLPPNWNFTFIDKVDVDYDGTVPTGLTWQSSTGDVRTSTGADSPSGEYWFNVTRGFSQFRFWQDSNSVWQLDRHRVDGSVMRYERLSGTVHWRPKTFFDPYDNAWTYYWNTSGTIDKIIDPRGVETHFVWGSGPTSLTVQYWMGTTHFTSLDHVLTWSGSQIYSFALPATTYLQALVSGVLYDVGNPSTDSRTFTFIYSGNNLTQVTDSRTSGYAVLTNTYTTVAGADRVETQYDAHGKFHQFCYSYDSLNVVLTTRYTDPMLNQHRFLTGSTATPKEYRITPATANKPRANAGDSPAEPNSLTWSFESNGCGCGLLTKVTYPSGLVYDMTYDGNGRLLTWSSLNPAGSGTVTYTWTHHGMDRGCRPDTYTPPSSGSAVSITHTYTWVNRASGLWGQKPTYITLSTSAISVSGSSSQIVTTYQDIDDYGRVAQSIDEGGTTFNYTYATTGAGSGLLSKVERSPITGDATHRVEFTVDDLGRLTESKEGTTGNLLTTTLTIDAFGRVLTETVDPSQGQPTMVTEYYRDQFENVAVVRHKNLDYGGTTPKYDDGSGSGRTWVRQEYKYFYELLNESYSDRRPLPEGENFSAPATGTDPWMVKSTFTYDDNLRRMKMTMPNGVEHTLVLDGYGTLYKTIADSGTGGSPVEITRAYYDSDLVLSEVRRKVVVSGSATWGSTTMYRNQSGKGPVYKVVGADGIRTENTFDAVNRIIDSSTWDSGGTRRLRKLVTYDELGRVLTEQRYLLDNSGGTVGTADMSFWYDVRSNLLRVEAPMGRKMFRTYDGYGRLATVHDNLSTSASSWNEVALSYVSGRDFVSSLVAKLFEESDDSSPPSGARNEYQTDYVRDLMGRVVQAQNKGQDGTQTALVSSYGYNALDMLTYFQSPEQQGNSTQYSRTVFDAKGRWVEFVKRASSTNSIRITSEYTDNSTTPETKRYDGSGFVTRTVLDRLYRVTDIYRPGYSTGPSYHTHFTYDDGTMVSTVTDGNGTVTTGAYDIEGRLLTRSVTPGTWVSYLATKESFTYDPIGRLDTAETRWSSGGANLMGKVDLDFDSLDRLLKESFTYLGVTGALDATSGYAVSGNSVGDPSFRRTLSYPSGFAVQFDPDAIGRMEAIQLTPPSAAQFQMVKYRRASEQQTHREARIGTGPVLTTDYGYDNYRRINLIEHKDGSGGTFQRFDLTWNAATDLVRKKHTKVDGSSGDLYDNDAYHRLIGAKQGVSSSQIDGSYGSATSVAKTTTYSLDPGQSRSSVTVTLAGGSPATEIYTKESNSQRYSSISGTSLITPLYDGEGNLIFDGNFYYVYDFRNRLSEVYVVQDAGAAAPSSSSNTTTSSGNVRREILPGSVLTRIQPQDLHGARDTFLSRVSGDFITYCQQNSIPLGDSRLLVTGQATGGSQTFSSASSSSSTSTTTDSFTLVLITYYGYDPFNRRIVRNTGDMDRRYVYDGWRELEERAVSGGATVDHLVTVRGEALDEIVAMYRKESGAWVGRTVYQDNLGSVVELRDPSGSRVERVEYDPFGNTSFFVGSSTTAVGMSSVENPWEYTGGRRDEETGMLYMRNRYMTVWWGRLMTRDPLGDFADAGSMGNPYVYVWNAPHTLVDPLGLQIRTLAKPLVAEGLAALGLAIPVVGEVALGAYAIYETYELLRKPPPPPRPRYTPEELKERFERWLPKDQGEPSAPRPAPAEPPTPEPSPSPAPKPNPGPGSGGTRDVSCEEGKCKPCTPVPAGGTMGVTDTEGKPHKPFGLPHTHYRVMDQTKYPGCVCHWGSEQTAKEPPPGMVPSPTGRTFPPEGGGGPM